MAIQEITSGVGVFWNAIKTKLNEMFVELYAKFDPAGAFMYLIVADAEALRTTITTDASTRYQVVGNFTTLVADDFTISSGVLTYTGTGGEYECTISAVQKSDTSSIRTHVSLHHKIGAAAFVERTSTVTGVFLKTADEALAHAPSMDVLTLTTGDQLKIMTWTDHAGAEVIATHMSLKLRPWSR